MIAALLLVIVASDAFTNAVEWIGVIFHLTRNAVGAVVAAIGSSLPETMVAIVALVLLHDARSQQVGIGAVLGAPFMLATIVFFLIGLIGVMRPPRVAGEQTSNILAVPLNDTLFGSGLFIVTFALALGASFTHVRPIQIVIALLLLLSYVGYLLYHLRDQRIEAEENPPPLRLAPRHRRPHLMLVALQLAASLAITMVAARWFVSSVSQASAALGISAFVVALFLAPIATELPDAANVVLWMRRGKDELALASVLGALMFQTSIASAIAIVATPWQLGMPQYVPSVLALSSALLLFVGAVIARRVLAWPLLAGGLLYFAYIAYVVIARPGA